MHLNLGSGTHPARQPDWIDFDLRWDGVIDPTVHGDAFALPFACRSIERVFASHILEHVRWEDLPAFWTEIHRVLHSGAVLMVVGPAIERAIARDEPKFLIEAIIGEGEGPGAHQWIPTEALTLRAVRMGFPAAEAVDVTDVLPPEWPNPTNVGWQCAVRALA